MRKALTLLLAMLLLVVGGGCAALTKYLLAQRDDVELEAETLYGDASALEGLSFQMEVDYPGYNDGIHWTVSGRMDQLDSVQTDSEPRKATASFEEDEDEDRQSGTLDLSGYSAADLIQLVYDAPELYADTPLQEAIEELAASTGAGETGVTILKASELQEYYLISPMLEMYKSVNGEDVVSDSITQYDLMTDDFDGYLDQLTQFKYSNSGLMERTDDEHSALYLIAALNDYFKIPVLENESYMLRIEKDEDGEILAASLSNGYTFQYAGNWDGEFQEAERAASEELAEEGDAYEMRGASVSTEDGIYFTFSTLTEQGNSVDVSELPDGYGIFFLPFSETEDEGDTSFHVDISGLSMVYALDVGTELEALEVNQALNQLLLFTAEDGKHTLTVIDLATMSTVQRLNLAGYGAITLISNHLEDGLLLVSDGWNLGVLTVEEDGSYVMALQCWINESTYENAVQTAYPELSYSEFLRMYDFCFDGSRLAVVLTMGECHCNAVLVYDETGLACVSLLTSSLNEGNPYGENKSCSLLDLTLAWDATS